MFGEFGVVRVEMALDRDGWHVYAHKGYLGAPSYDGEDTVRAGPFGNLDQACDFILDRPASAPRSFSGIRFLGDGRTIEVRGSKVALGSVSLRLAYLLAQNTSRFSTAQDLASDLWAVSPPKAKKNITHQIWRLKCRIVDHGLTVDSQRPQAYRLRWLDTAAPVTIEAVDDQ